MSHEARAVFPEVFNLADYFLFDRLREGLGDSPAIVFGERVYSYSQVAEGARALRGFFALSAVLPEQRVLIILHDSPAYAWSFFAALYHGAVVAMANPDAPAAELAWLISYVRPAAVVTNPRVAHALRDALGQCDLLRSVVLVPEVATGGDVMSLTESVSDPRGVPLAEALSTGSSWSSGPRPTLRDDVAVWLFTSGSTGRSRAAMHTHRDFGFNTERYAKATVGFRRGDLTLSVPRLFFGYATGTNLMFPFAVGATTALFSERPTASGIASMIEKFRPTVVTNVPTMMGKLLEEDDLRRARGEPSMDFSSVRFHLSAGEALPPSLLARFTERFGAEVYDGIGSAEMFHIYCTNRPGDVKPGSLGRVVEGYELKVLSSEALAPGEPELAPGETGVMWVRGESVALGYFQDREKSWQTFHGRWCRTGDLFRVDPEGYLWFSGRADDLLKVGGIWVAPTEVEECLMEHPWVSLAAVIGASDGGLVKPKAFVVLRESAKGLLGEGLAAELKDFVKARLSKHKYPRWVVFVDDIEKNDRGKVDKKSLRERESRGDNPVGE